MHIDDLVIEVTRKCNIVRSHCLRGASESLDIKEEYIEGLFSRIASIGTLSITGGEPSLVPEKINLIVDIAKNYNVPIDRFYMVTNAKKVTNEFLIAVFNLYTYCDNSDTDFSSTLDISNDQYHLDELTDDNGENAAKLKAFTFTGNKESKSGAYYDNALIDQGNASENYCSCRDYYLSEYGTEKNDGDGDALYYLNAKGVLVTDCNLSYETQDNVKFLQLGHVLDSALNIEEASNAYNERLGALDSTLLGTILETQLTGV